ncbi:MAG: glycosyl hydrolase [Saprospiraceae bacterium]|nr:glycosyl hydrolase [Saprospiraceae bacterium]
MIKLNRALKLSDFSDSLERFWELSGQKILSIENEYDAAKGSPVFTAAGKYTTRGWTEWTQGFQYGSALLQYDAVDKTEFLDIGRSNTLRAMAPHVSHIGVHDHGFNNVSTYGNLLRLIHEGKVENNFWERQFYELALKISGAVQASRWTPVKGGGFIHSFNGPHSLFVDTIRSCRALMVSHLLGHVFQSENDIRINLLERAFQHIKTTNDYSIYYGKGRDRYDVPGRTAHECIFNTKDGNYRCPNSQQGYSGFTTWTRGLAWAICGMAEQLELVDALKVNHSPDNLPEMEILILNAAKITSDFYIHNSATDGVPYWDTGAPGLNHLGDYLDRPAEPYNIYEPVDSSAAAIASQGLLRLGHYLNKKGNEAGEKYWQAGLTVLNTLFKSPYLSEDPAHQGLLLHSIYHRPNGWDYVAPGASIPYGESSMWGDYHIREVALYITKMLKNEPYYTFFNGIEF